MFQDISNFIESILRWMIVTITNYLPVKVIRDDRGVPFLYRYHLFTFGNDGPGMCIHRFVRSDPERGYHDHPWNRAISFILAGGYSERIYDQEKSTTLTTTLTPYNTYQRPRWTFNYLKGKDVYHRVMIEEGKDAWTLFAFGPRTKTWGMIGLDGMYKAMSTTINDQDGGWWNHVIKGIGLHTRLAKKGTVVATVDIVIIAENKVLLIKRGKEPFKDKWALPGGRIEATDKDILFAAQRELKEETGITDVPLEYFKTIGDVGRDPRGFCVTTIYVARLDKIPSRIRAGDDAVDWKWFNVADPPEMAFDHKDILMHINEKV